MKPNHQTLLVVALGVLVIGVALVYTVSNQMLSSDELSSNPVVLKRLHDEVKQELDSFKMKKIIRQDRGALILRKENFTQISNYQKYVTPNNLVVKEYVSSNNIETPLRAYTVAVGWTWVSDQTLHNKAEQWMMPRDFIQATPNMPTNPRPGFMVSDCESQAYTLVSILESIGTSPKNVRVVVGEVNFSGVTGGHAWVQIYENNQWSELEATSGPSWNDETGTLENENSKGFSYNYFKTHPYPVVEYWAYFNDQYYYNPDNGQKSHGLPDHWLT